MTEKVLVFKGNQVLYDSHDRKIFCTLGDNYFKITDVTPETVIGLGVKMYFYMGEYVRVEGTELWKDGPLWIITGWRSEE